MGGVFNVVSLHLYHYAGIGQRSDSELQANNPVKYIDPDGKDIDTVTETIKLTIDLGKQVAPLFEKPNPNNLMSETKARKLSGSMNLSSSVNLKYSAQFQPNFGSSFNLGINLNGNLNKMIGDKHSLSFGISAGFTIPSKLMPTMKFSFLYEVQL